MEVGAQTSGVGLTDGLADLVDEVVGELHGVGLRRRRAGRQAPLALRQHLLQLLRQRCASTYHHARATAAAATATCGCRGPTDCEPRHHTPDGVPNKLVTLIRAAIIHIDKGGQTISLDCGEFVKNL